MLLSIQGYTSSYSLWIYVKNNKNKTKYVKPVAYKNINQRFLRLARLGFLEEVQLGNNPHRRIDYKLTSKGMELLIPYILTHPEEVENMFQYIDKVKFDKQAFGSLLSSRIINALNTAAIYTKAATRLGPLSMNIAQIEQLQKSIAKYHEELLEIKDALIIQQQHQTQKQMVESKSKTSIDTILSKYYEELCHNLETNNIMSTLQDNGTKIRLSYIHPHKSKDIARLTKSNIEKMKKTLPHTTETIKHLENLIKSTDKENFRQVKTAEPLIISIKKN